MKFRPFSLCCECGLVPTRIRQVGLSVEHQLVIHWWCVGCRKAVFVVKDLAECWEESPSPEELGLAAAPVNEPATQAADASFLRSMGIRFPGTLEP
ncbi:MAG TPA: hypothetical protein VLY04_02125 [Bryobacteraceae bacterium]|nr:hypothetical protein [Bryobacteraceae bacterium]